MLGTQGATIVILLMLAWTSVAGVVAGAVTCLVLRRRWGPKAALIDALLSPALVVVLFLIAAEVEGFFGVYRSLNTPVAVIALAGVVARYLMPSRVVNP